MEYETRCGESVPKVGYGTWQLSPEQARDCVRHALDSGYRHIDTAQVYENETAVGGAIAASEVPRDEIFLTTKVNPTHRTVEDIVASARRSVDRLGVDTVDLLLIHWPNPVADMETVLEGLNETIDRNLTRFIGVSNFNRKRLKKAQRLSDAPIFTNQVLFHPWHPQRKLLRHCQETDVLLTAYSPLANGGAIHDTVLAEIGSRYGKSGPQTAIRWSTQHKNVVTIPMSTSPEHITQNIDVFDFMLTRAEHDEITRPSYLQTGVAMLRGQIGI